MAKGVDDRIVSISFDNAKFEANVKATITSLSTLDAAIRKVGTGSGLDNISKSANKVDFKSLSDAIDKINAKLQFPEGAKGLSDLEAASNKTQLTGVSSAIDKVKQKLGFDTKGITDIEGASNRVTLSGIGNAIDKVKQKLASLGGGNDIAALEGASDRVTLSSLGNAVDSVTAKFSNLQVVGVAALAGLVASAAGAGSSMVKSLTIEPVTTGLSEYETKLNAIQTILANTQAAGTNLGDVTNALDELNTYADLTIYNFGQMAKNIGTFTAAGVDLDTATASIKGIANLAALSGSNSQQASTAMYQLSQEIAAGRVSLMGWNSVVNAGMGGSVFQRALVQTAQQMGTLSGKTVEFQGKMKNAVIDGKSFRESIMSKPGEQSWLTKEVLTGTLEQLTGDMSDAELAAKGYSKAQIKAIQDQAKAAVDAATKVKTLSGVIDTAKESAGSGWAKTWELIFGNFNEARTTFTGISEALNGFIGRSADARNALIKDWKSLGGRAELFAGLKAVLEGIGSVLKPIKEAFRDIFPKKTGMDLYDLTVKFRNFAETLKIGPETADALKRTFRGFFAVLDIGKMVVGEVLGVIGKLLGVAGKGSGGFLSFTAAIGDFIVGIRDAIKNGDGLSTIFDSLAGVLSLPIKLLGALGEALSTVFGGADTSAGAGAGESFNKLGDSLKPIPKLMAGISAAWETFVSLLSEVGSLLEPVFDEFRAFGDKVAEAFGNGGFEAVFDVIQTGLIAGIFLAIKNGLKNGIGLDIGAGGVFDSLGETFGILNKNLTAMQTNIKANTLLQIATAITVLAAGVLILSLIDPGKLAVAMTATATGLGQLVGAMALLTKIGGAGAFVTMPIIAASLVLLAVAVDILAIAVLALAQLSWEQIAKGLAGVGGALLAISVGTKLMGPQLLAVGPALIPIAIALNLMALSMMLFATLSWEEIGKGIAGIAVGLLAVGVAARAVGPGLLVSGPGLIAMAIGLNILALAVLAFGKMDLKTLATGIIAATVAIGLLGVAAGLLPPTLALQAAGLVILGIALTGIAAAVKLMGSMSVGELATGILGLGAALLVLAGGLTLMGGTIPGTVALLGAAVALSILVPVLGILGNMKWSTIGKGIAAIAAVLATIAVVGLIAAPALALVGVALVILGAGVAAIGAGVYLIAKGLALLGAEGQKGIAVMITAFTAFLALLPRIIIDFVKGLVAIVDGIVALAPKIVGAFSKILIIMLDTIILAAPKAAQAMVALITAMLTVLNSQAGPLIAAGWSLIQKLLQGFSDHAGELAAIAGTAVTNLLNGLASKAGDMVTAGGNLIISILRGIVNQQSRMITAGVQMITNFLRGITNNIGKIATEGARIATRFVSTVANSAGKMLTTGTNFIVKMVTGIGNAGSKLVTAGTSAATKFVRAAASGLVKMADEGLKAIVLFINGVAAAIESNSADLNAAGVRLANAIFDGVISAIGAQAGNIVDRLVAPFKGAVDRVKKFLGINSPSKVFEKIGMGMMLGTQLGVQRNASGVIASVDDVSYSLIAAGSKMAANIGKGIDADVTAEAAAKKKVSKIMKAYREGLSVQRRSTSAAQELGKYLGKDFADGLAGSQEDIDKAFAGLNDKLQSSMDAARQIIKDQQAKLSELFKAKKLDYTAIARAQAVINQNELLLLSAGNAKSMLSKISKDTSAKLLADWKAVEDATDKLKEYENQLASAISAKESAAKSFTDSFKTLPDLGEVGKQSAAKYVSDLKQRAAAVEKFRLTLDRLRVMGLDDATYQKLLSEGPDAQGFATQLEAGGPAMLAEIKSIDSQLETSATTLGTTAAANLNDAGIAAIRGLITGAQSEKTAAETTYSNTVKDVIKKVTDELKIEGGSSKKFKDAGVQAIKGFRTGLNDKNERGKSIRAIEELVDDLIAQVKRKLQIRSPSRVFEGLGGLTTLGFARGISSESPTVISAVGGIGDDAVTTMRSSMGELSAVLSDEIDPNPVITPVLDLSDISSNAKKLQDLTNVTPISAAASYMQAASITAATRATAEQVSADQATKAQEIKFEQNNYSPEALSETEIYRLTNNQLSQARKALGLAG